MPVSDNKILLPFDPKLDGEDHYNVFSEGTNEIGKILSPSSKGNHYQSVLGFPMSSISTPIKYLKLSRVEDFNNAITNPRFNASKSPTRPYRNFRSAILFLLWEKIHKDTTFKYYVTSMKEVPLTCYRRIPDEDDKLLAQAVTLNKWYPSTLSEAIRAYKDNRLPYIKAFQNYKYSTVSFWEDMLTTDDNKLELEFQKWMNQIGHPEWNIDKIRGS